MWPGIDPAKGCHSLIDGTRPEIPAVSCRRQSQCKVRDGRDSALLCSSKCQTSRTPIAVSQHCTATLDATDAALVSTKGLVQGYGYCH
jgi:hypothetical protein